MQVSAKCQGTGEDSGCISICFIHRGEWEGSSKGPDLEAEKFLLFCWHVSQATGRMSNQDGAAVDVALCLCLNEQNRSCGEQPVLFLFYRSGGLGCKPLNLHLLCFWNQNTLIPNKQLTRRTWHSWMQTCHRNETRLLTDVLGIPFDVSKFTGIVVGIFSHLKNQPPVQLLLSGDKINGPQLVAWLAHLRKKQCPFEGAEEPGWNLVPHFE